MLVYNFLRYLLYIAIFFVSFFNKKLSRFIKKRLFQNIENKNFSSKDVILVHMSSVGEFNLSKELIEELLRKGERVLISVMTDTGYNAVKKAYDSNENVEIIYFPLDDLFVIKRICEKFNIKKVIIIETEIWPNLYYFAQKKSQLYIVNGRLTEKKMKSYLKMKFLVKKVLNSAKRIMVQSKEDKGRYLRLGINENKIKVYKNLKYSIKYEKISEEKKEKYYRNCVNRDKKIIVCGSTRPGEEKIWLEAFSVINKNDEYQLVIVPRHLERVQEIEDEIKRLFSENDYELFSKIQNFELEENIDSEDILKRKTDKNEKKIFEKEKIVLVDKMGVLRDFYQLADYVFVGGTLVNIGGHSILEPLYYNKVPIIGKYYQNIEEIVNEARKMNYVKIVENEDDIIESIKSEEILDTSKFFEKNNELEKIVKELYCD